MSRKDILKLLALGGVAASSGYAIREYAPFTDYNAQVARPRRLLQTGTDKAETMKGIIRYATLAANGHNAQAWKFALHPNAIEIHPDLTRRLSAVDPDNRELWISLGCALENLLIASRAMGFTPTVRYPDTDDYIRVNLAVAPPEQDELFNAIPLRQSTRTEYDKQTVSKIHLAQLEKVSLEPGIRMDMKLDGAGLKLLSELVHQSTVSQYSDALFLKELVHWLRFDKKEALNSFDGLYSKCTGNPGVPRWLGRFFVNGSKPEQLAEADVRKLKSSAGAIIISSSSEGRSDWVRSGQVYQRLALTMTSLNIKSAFLNQPIEVAPVRSELQTSLGLGDDRPQMLLRFGYANLMPGSLRRPIETLLLSS